ncbi:MAG: hypothetical protein K5837_04765 [Candidatus Saccharibacteria bacterium]|nr:hypothetical protein [Candidatus Saccharibacteria bacterium]
MIGDNKQPSQTKCATEEVAKTNTIVTGDASFNVPNPARNEGNLDGTVKFEYGVFNNILSTYSISYYEVPTGDITSKVISNNIDLATGEKLDNEAVLDKFGLTAEEIYRKILENISETVTVDSFLLNTSGNILDESISVDAFKRNIDKYIETLKTNYDLFYIFLKDSNITISYQQHKLLEKLGMSSHMDTGLVNGYVEIKI